MRERQVDISTDDGLMTTFVCHPERDGPHPALLFFMDAWGIREELRDMARRYATVGYYVLLPNLYYRAGFLEPGPIPHWDGSGTPPQSPVSDAHAQLNVARVMADTRSIFAYMDTDPAACRTPGACVGYCMSGRFSVNAAARYPDRIVAAASHYGTQLMTSAPDSPHLMARQARAEFYFSCAEMDHWAPLEMVHRLRADLAAGGVKAEVEVYPGVEHAFAFPQRQTYNRAAAERHWERMFSLLRRCLG